MTEKLYDKLELHQNRYLKPQTKDADQTLTVSFVIPVFNSASSIQQTVDSIVYQENSSQINEVILINDGSSDDSLQVMQEIKATSKLRVIIVDNATRKYSAFSRNRGIERATGDLICFIDSDIILPKDYMEQHIQFHKNNDCITFSLRCNISTASQAKFPVVKAVGDFRRTLISESQDLQNVPFSFSETHTLPELCLTCAVTYLRKDLLKVKGCPENFVGWGFNDTAMAAKVIALGRSVVPVISASVYHLEHSPRSGKTTKK